MNPQIIGISGKARSGKDTIADHLVNNHRFLRVGIADRIKLTASIMFNTPISWFYDSDHKETIIPKWDKSPRMMAQLVGTEAGRNIFGDKLWFDPIEEIIQDMQDMQDVLCMVPKWLRDVPMKLPSQYLNYYVGVVIPDARLDFEFDWIQNDLNGHLFGVYRDGADGEVGIKNHATEIFVNMDKCDVSFENNLTIQHLTDSVDNMLKHFE